MTIKNIFLYSYFKASYFVVIAAIIWDSGLCNATPHGVTWCNLKNKKKHCTLLHNFRKILVLHFACKVQQLNVACRPYPPSYVCFQLFLQHN